MKAVIQLLVILMIIAGANFIAYGKFQPRTYAGNEIRFTSSGDVSLRNPHSNIGLFAQAREDFVLRSEELQLSMAPQRRGTGVLCSYEYMGRIPPGASTLQVVSGQNVTFEMKSSDDFEVEVQRNHVTAVRFGSGILSIGLFAYSAFTIQQGWMRRKSGLFARLNNKPRLKFSNDKKGIG